MIDRPSEDMIQKENTQSPVKLNIEFYVFLA